MNQTIAKQELDFIQTIQVLSFTANPNRVQPFGKTTVSWDVKLPAGSHPAVALQVGGRPVGLTGSTTFTVSADAEFDLTASMTVIKQAVLSSVQVTLDGSSCRAESFPASVLTVPIQDGITAAFTGHLAGTVQVGPPGDGGSLPIQIPIEGGLNVSLDLSIGQGNNQQVAVFRDSVDASVNSGIDPEGCGDKVKSVAIAFMTHIVDNELVPQIAKTLNDQIQQIEASASSGDRFHRQFALTAFSLSSNGISFTLCPTTRGTVVVGTGGGGVLTSQ
jgi:hypothetical protein